MWPGFSWWCFTLEFPSSVLFYSFLFSQWNVSMVLRIRPGPEGVIAEQCPQLRSAPSLPADGRSPQPLAKPLCVCFAQMNSCMFISRFSHLYSFLFPFIINWKSVTALASVQYPDVQMKLSLCNCCPACGPGDRIQYSQWWMMLKRIIE